MNAYVNKLKRDMNIYIVSNLMISVLFVVLLFRLLWIGGLGDYTFIIVLISFLGSIGITYYCFRYYKKKKMETFLKVNGIRIKATIDKEEFKIGGNNIRHICYLVAYYTENGKTYIFKDSISDFNSRFVFDIKTIKEKGFVPLTVDVVIDPNNYKNYMILKYDYLCEMYQANAELVNFFIL